MSYLVSEEGPRQETPISTRTALANAYISPDEVSKGIEWPWEMFAQAIPCDAVDVVFGCLTQMRDSGYRIDYLTSDLLTLLQEILRQMRDDCAVGPDGHSTVFDQRSRAEYLALTLATLDFGDPSQESFRSFVKSSLRSCTPGTGLIWLRTLSLGSSEVRRNETAVADFSMEGTTPPLLVMADPQPQGTPYPECTYSMFNAHSDGTEGR